MAENHVSDEQKAENQAKKTVAEMQKHLIVQTKRAERRKVEKEDEQDDVFVVSRLWTLIPGLIISVALAFAAATLAGGLLHWAELKVETEFNVAVHVPHAIELMAKLGIGIVMFGWFFFHGLIELAPAHNGVILFLGGRVRSVRLGEGKQWTPPRPFVEVQAVNMEEQTVDIPNQKVLAQNVPVDIDASAQVVIWDPYQFLQVGESTAEQGLTDLIRDALRYFAGPFEATALTMLAVQTHMRDILETLGDLIAKRQWGIDVRRVLITNIMLPPDVTAANARILIERSQRESEHIEAQTLTDLVKLLTNAGVPASEALLALQAERDKLRRTQEIFTIDTKGGDIPSAAILAGLMRWVGKDKKEPTKKGG